MLALLLCVSTAISMTGCGSKSESVEATEAVENTESTEELPAVPLAQYDLKGSDYVTLCDYSAIPVTISGDYDVTDQDVLDYVEKIFFKVCFCNFLSCIKSIVIENAFFASTCRAYISACVTADTSRKFIAPEFKTLFACHSFKFRNFFHTLCIWRCFFIFVYA